MVPWIYEICACGWSGFPPDGLPCLGGKMLPLACDGCCQEKERKNQHVTKKTTAWTSGGEWKWACGASDGCWSHPTVGCSTTWDARARSLLEHHPACSTTAIPWLLYKSDTRKYISISRNQSWNRSLKNPQPPTPESRTAWVLQPIYTSADTTICDFS